MFESLQDTFEDFNESLDDTGFVKKAASAAQGNQVIDVDKLDSAFQELELALMSAGVNREVAKEIVTQVREELDGQQISMTDNSIDVVRRELSTVVRDVMAAHHFSFAEAIQENERPVTIMFTGINGVGKTTTIAKMAYWLRGYGYDVVLANGDTFRAGASEQINEHADTLGVRLIEHEQGSDPAAVLYDAVEYAEANDIDVVLADTAGRLNTDSGLMNQLDKIERVVNPTYTIFVDEAVAGQDAVRRSKDFSETVDTNAVILTKVDASKSGGAVLSIPKATGIPLLFLGIGETYNDLVELDADGYAEQIVGVEPTPED